MAEEDENHAGGAIFIFNTFFKYFKKK